MPDNPCPDADPAGQPAPPVNGDGLGGANEAFPLPDASLCYSYESQRFKESSRCSSVLRCSEVCLCIIWSGAVQLVCVMQSLHCVVFKTTWSSEPVSEKVRFQMFVILRNPRSTDRSLWVIQINYDLDQLCMKNAAADRIEDQLFSTEKVYRRVCILQKEITPGEWTMGRLSDHIDCHLDSLTEIEKDRTATRLRWDNLGKADEKLPSDLTAFQRFISEQAEEMTESHGAGRNGSETAARSGYSTFRVFEIAQPGQAVPVSAQDGPMPNKVYSEQLCDADDAQQLALSSSLRSSSMSSAVF
ncbi:erythrocytic,Spectrin alpha chain [Trichinella spiralis]|uniref:Erythrocytic,Spectrin alpha chain n=1 Tax=Trichinella spiralis TaxID=6334 RepID=A0ABR3K913_TRISP